MRHDPSVARSLAILKAIEAPDTVHLNLKLTGELAVIWEQLRAHTEAESVSALLKEAIKVRAWVAFHTAAGDRVVAISPGNGQEPEEINAFLGLKHAKATAHRDIQNPDPIEKAPGKVSRRTNTNRPSKVTGTAMHS